eukprot:TRINITY_DN18718_c0_g1_i1.p1 TRINITY_DN18718_c0_g1~~TRINITY_DN18718_c0_g1_i1.p1  ORF type:complete len:924 (+),score=159.10 TRINITY_DN18718_c0_g1_i1:90-2861(+)
MSEPSDSCIDVDAVSPHQRRSTFDGGRLSALPPRAIMTDSPTPSPRSMPEQPLHSSPTGSMSQLREAVETQPRPLTTDLQTARSSFRKSWDGQIDSLRRSHLDVPMYEKPRSASEGGEQRVTFDASMDTTQIATMALQILSKSLKSVSDNGDTTEDAKQVLGNKLALIGRALYATVICLFITVIFTILLVISDANGYYDWDGKVQAYYFMGSIMTLISGTYVIYTYLVLGPLNQHPASLHIWGTVCDMMLAIPLMAQFFDQDYEFEGLVETERRSQSCKVYSFLTQVSLFGSATWFFLLSWDLFLALRRPFGNNLLELTRYHVCAWFFSVLTGALLLMADFEGISHVCLCWIKSRARGEFNYRMWTLYYFTICFYFSFSVGVLVYSAFKWNMWSRTEEAENTEPRNPGDKTVNVLNKTLHIRKLVIRQNAFHIMAYGAYFTLIFSLYYAYDLVRSEADDSVYCDTDTQKSIVLLKTLALLVSGKGVIDAVVWYYKSYLGQLNKEVLASAEVAEQMRKDVMQCTLIGIRDTAEMASGPHIQDIHNQRYFHSLLEINVEGKSTQHSFIFRSYAMLVFRHIRESNGITTEGYIQSLSNPAVRQEGGAHREDDAELKETFSEGRSGSFLYFSSDRRFIIKTLSKSEALLLLDILKDYHNHITTNPDTFITRLYGLHSINIYGMRMYFVVMENVVHIPKDRTVLYTFDLKGSWIDREVGVDLEANQQKPSAVGGLISKMLGSFQVPRSTSTNRSGGATVETGRKKLGTLKDIDFEKIMMSVRIQPEARDRLIHQIQRDTEFFKNLNIMDYSLLLVVSEGIKVSMVENKGPQAHGESPTHQGGQRVPFFRQYMGGLPAFIPHGPSEMDLLTDRCYHLGIIDLLQEYNLNKKGERWIKVNLKRKDPHGISCIAPDEYALRFRKMVGKVFS